jgi:hypothetical protein
MRRSCRLNRLSQTFRLTISRFDLSRIKRAIHDCHGVGFAEGELVGATVGPAGGEPAGLGVGNANVGDGDAPGLAEMTGDCETVGVGVGGGGIIFSQ